MSKFKTLFIYGYISKIKKSEPQEQMPWVRLGTHLWTIENSIMYILKDTILFKAEMYG